MRFGCRCAYWRRFYAALWCLFAGPGLAVANSGGSQTSKTFTFYSILKLYAAPRYWFCGRGVRISTGGLFICCNCQYQCRFQNEITTRG